MRGTDGEAGVEDRASLVMATQRNGTKRETWKRDTARQQMTWWELEGDGDEQRSLVEYKASIVYSKEQDPM